MNWDLPGITAALARQHRVLSLDCLGHGRSGRPGTEGAYGTNRVEDVVRLMDRLHMDVEPRQKIRTDWPAHLVVDTGHLNCVMQPEFKAELEAALATGLAAKPR